MKSLVATAAIAATMVAITLWPRIVRAALLKAGRLAPDFRTEMIVGDEIQWVRLSDFRGKRVVLYFYPKDFTSGCTKEACAFRDGFARFQRAGIVILGCSVDSSDSHRKFIKKHGLPFPLLLDHDKSIASAYGAANGIPILGYDRRVTYLIDGDGKIVKVYPRVDPSKHATEILEALGADKIPVAETSPAGPSSAPAASQAPPKASAN